MYYLYDYHIHSINSHDGKESVVQICKAALDKGISEIAITDHFEPTVDGEDYGRYNPDSYWEDIKKAREKFKGRLKIKSGVELGQPYQFPKISRRFMNSYKFDYVIGSAHWLSTGEDLALIDYSKISLDDICIVYIKELSDLIAWGDFDCLGHLDLVKRYTTGKYPTRVTLVSYYELLKEILTTVISLGKGIEINASGLRQAPKETFPGLDALKLYKELGGEILTIGSDAHRFADVGSGIEQAIDLAQEAGFRYITVFENRVPSWIKIAAKNDVYNIS